MQVRLLAFPYHIPAPARRVVSAGREVAIITIGALLYFFVRGLVDAREQVTLAHAWDIVRLEQRLGVFIEQDVQKAIASSDWLITLANWIYIYGHWPVVIATLCWLLARHQPEYARYRNALLISGGIGLIIFALYPVAPPRFLPELGFWDSVTARSNSYRVLQPPSPEARSRCSAWRWQRPPTGHDHAWSNRNRQRPSPVEPPSKTCDPLPGGP